MHGYYNKFVKPRNRDNFLVTVIIFNVVKKYFAKRQIDSLMSNKYTFVFNETVVISLEVVNERLRFSTYIPKGLQINL